MPRIVQCPDEAALRKLLASNLTDGALADVVAHVDGCSACQSLIEQLGNDGSRAPRPEARFRSSVSADPACDEVVDRLIRLVRGETLGTSAGTVFDSTPVPERLGHFRIDGVLGRGGMGAVLKGWDTKLNRFVAIKQLRPQLMHNHDLRDRILAEARAAAAISHPHVVPVYSVHEESEPAFFVMELVEGPSLQKILDERPLPSVGDAIGIVRQVLEALEAAHTRGVVHCDIKPANVLLDAHTNRVRLTDFGISYAATASDSAHPEKYLGTPRYMSPEQCRGEQVDRRTDLFSTGVLLYRLLTGVLPFSGDTVDQLKASICNDRPVPVRNRRPDVPAKLAATVDRLLEKNPNDRFASAAEALQSLERSANRSQPRFAGRVALAAACLIGVVAVIFVVSDAWREGRKSESVATGANSKANQPESPAVTPGSEIRSAFFLGEPSKVTRLEPDPNTKIEFQAPNWRVVDSFRFEGRVRAAKFCPLDGSIWFSHIDAQQRRGIYRLGPSAVSPRDLADESGGWVPPTPERWRPPAAIARILAAPETNCLEFSDDGTLVAYPYNLKGLVIVTDVRTGAERGSYFCQLDRDNDPCEIAFVPKNFAGDVAAPGDILTLDFGFPSGEGSLWKCTLPDARCTQMGRPGAPQHPTGITCSSTTVFVSRRAARHLDEPDHAAHRTTRLLEVLPGSFRPLSTTLPIAQAEGMKYDPVTSGLLMMTRTPERLVHIDVSSDDESKPVTVIATGFSDPRGDCLDISRDGRYVLVSDVNAGTIYVLERELP